MSIGTVSLRSFYDENWSITYAITGTILQADTGKLVTQDTSAANTAKLAGDGDLPLGVLSTLENRIQEGIVVGAVAMKGVFAIPTTGAVALGASVVGSATPGVAKAAAAGSNQTRVVEILSGNRAVVIFG